MICVPIYCCKQPVAVLTLASSQTCAFANEGTLVLLAAMLAPYVQTLQYESLRSEMNKVVQQVLMPLAAELSVQQGRFKRIKNACGEEILCLDESCGLNGSKLASEPPSQVRRLLIRNSVPCEHAKHDLCP
jgi:hypothetical protein